MLSREPTTPPMLLIPMNTLHYDYYSPKGFDLMQETYLIHHEVINK